MMGSIMTNSGKRREQSGHDKSSPQEFTQTRWSKVVLASRGDSPPSRQALEELCQRYWHPIYGFLRRERCSPQDAEDLTQQFFSSFLAKDGLAAADPSKGRFRTFLLKSLRNFQIDQARKTGAQKRGGGNIIVSLDREEAEQRYEQEPDPGLSPEKVYDLQWATTLLEQALQRLHGEFEKAGQTAKFELLKTFLSQEPEPDQYDQVAEALKMSKRAVTCAVHRLRQRYGQLVRLEVGETVTNANEVEKELRELFG
jgi:RNA polymerase sigma factor (sigma-70 family)